MHTRIGGFDGAIQYFLRKKKTFKVSFSFTSPPANKHHLPPASWIWRISAKCPKQPKHCAEMSLGENSLNFVVAFLTHLNSENSLKFFQCFSDSLKLWKFIEKKYFGVFLTHRNRCFSLALPSVSSRALLFSLPWLVFEINMVNI